MATLAPNFTKSCIYFEDLKAANAGPLEILVHDAPGHRIKTGLWSGEESGCRRTTDHKRGLFIEGGSDNLRSIDIGETVLIRLDWRKHANDPKTCVLQWDTKDTTNGEFIALLVTYKRERDCTEANNPPKPPVVPPKPPIIVVPPHIPEVPVVPPYEPPVVPVPVPEPATWVLLAMGLVVVLPRLRQLVLSHLSG